MRRHAIVLGLALMAAFVATPTAALLPAATPLAAPVAAAASSGLTMTADTRYTVDPAKHRVRVAVTLLAKNHRTDTKTRRYFYDRAYLAVQPDIANPRIKSDGASPTVAVQRRTSTFTLLRINFGKQLSSGASRQLSLSYDIVDKGGAPTRATRVGTTLVSFAAWGLGMEGSPGGSVSVVFPAGYSVDVDAEHLGPPVTDSSGLVRFTTGPLADPLSFFAFFVADRPGSYKESTINVAIGDRTVPVTIRAWPDDPVWAKRVTSLLKRGLPALATDIGLPWLVDRPLVVSEAITRNSTGFAGRYNSAAGEVEIAYYATPFVILHEAAHAWFDGHLLADRWATEGFASYYALRAAKAIGEKKVAGDVLTEKLEKLRIPLNAWAAPGEDSAVVEDAEYAAALRLATQIGERAGPDQLRAVWQAIHQERAAYQPTGPGAALETSADAPDWRGLLDLLEERTGAPYDDLWTAWVIRPAEAGLIGQRTDARDRYTATAQRADTWLLPRVVRDALRAWQYDQVDELLVGANRALDDRDAVRAAADAAGLTPPSTMETDFEGPRGFAAASAEAEAELAAIAAYETAAAARTDSPDLLAQIGLWNSDPAATLAEAAAAYASGDLQASVQASTFAQRLWTSASEIGRNRVIAGAGSIAALLLGLWLAIQWFRGRGSRRRRQHARLIIRRS